MYTHLYSRFLSADPTRLHFTAHSHHLWPNVTRDAQLQYWDDTARLTDHKWDLIFTELLPEAQKHIAQHLNLTSPERICFAPNTHDFVTRLFSCFTPGNPITVLTTDSEFHSFRRQLNRFEEEGNYKVTRISTDQFTTFEERFIQAANSSEFDIIFVSQVFFNSGMAIKNLVSFVKALGQNHKMIVIDGYHAFCALPTDLKVIEDRIFYLAGGYKYAQAGEGACFLHVPKNCLLRPIDTGWYASFETLESAGETKIQYSNSGYRFFGATFDPSGIYRFNSVMQLLQDNNLTIPKIHEYVSERQNYFLETIVEKTKFPISHNSLLQINKNWHGHFLTFVHPQANDLCKKLNELNIITDVRGDRLRFGFGLYHTDEDIDELKTRLEKNF